MVGGQDKATVIMPRTPDAASALRMVQLSIVKVLEFSLQTLRSGSVVVPSDVSNGSGLLFLRGAPAVIRTLVRLDSVPLDFDQVLLVVYNEPY